jgi:tol-pal system protein YbgF
MRRLTVSALVLVFSGCFFPADRGRVLEERVDSIGAENAKLKASLKDNQDKLDQTTARLQDALAQLDTASRTTGANIGVKVDGAIQDVAMLRGQIEADQHRLQELEQKVSTQASATPSGSTPAEPKKEELKKPDDPKDFLKLADDKAKAGDQDLARRLYTEFLKKWPRDDGAGEAHFAIGESWFGEQKCREALYEFGKVIQDHPKTRSAPTAYLRSADCFKELKMVAEAKLALEEVQKQFPKSDAAKTAKQKLADLSKPEPKKGAKK